MGRKPTRIRVFVASPGDVSEERRRLSRVIEELNDSVAIGGGLKLQMVGWENDAWTDVGQNAQEVTNRQITPHDIFVGILWERFGTLTRRAGSGTEEEFERAFGLWSEYGRPRVVLYFNQAPFFPSSEDEAKQIAKVLALKTKAVKRSAPCWDYNGPDHFERSVRQHLIREILRWPDYGESESPRTAAKLPLSFYQGLFNEIDMYTVQFDQLKRDYGRELRGQRLVFAADFSELHNYMYRHSPESPRSSLNRYVFDTLENPFTLMPGAVGELLTDLERALPSSDVPERDLLAAYKDVATFIYEFPTALGNEERIVELYGRAEAQLKRAWGEFFEVVMQGVHYTAFHAVKSLMDQGRLSPIEGVQEITPPLPPDWQQRAQWVRSELNLSRPGKVRNNRVDAIDFAVTWLLNEQGRERGRRYLSIYTQSRAFINACSAKWELRWEEDYLVRGARYLKFRTRLQEMFPSSTKRRQEFVVEWAAGCRRLQKEISNLVDLEKELPELREPSLHLLDLYRQFDQECRTPLEYTGEAGERERASVRARAEELFALLKDDGEFKGRTGEAFELLKEYLRDLQERVALFAPDKARTTDAEAYMENLAGWLRSESLER